MDVFRAGEVLLRSSSPLLPFLAPAVYKLSDTTRAAAAALTRHHTPQRSQCQSSRSFSSITCRGQRGATSPQPEQHDAPSHNLQPKTPSSGSSIGQDLSSLLDESLNFTKGAPTAPTPRASKVPSRNAQASNPPSHGRAATLSAARPAQGNSLAELIDAMGPPTGQNRPSQAFNSAANIMGMLDSSSHGPAQPPPEAEERAPMKLGPTIGRTVEVNTQRGMDVGRAFRTLEMQCARNSVRKDFMRQRFHERPGLKRKRLKSERWRRNFKIQFKGVVSMVQKMRKQGW